MLPKPKPLTPKRTKSPIFTIRVTDVLFNLETIEDSGLPQDFLWRSDGILYGLRVKGKRIDQTNMPAIDVLVPVQTGGQITTVQIGDILYVYQPIPNGNLIAIGVAYSQTSDWSEAIKRNERPMPPQLESPGSSGNLQNYNAIYGTYIPTYEPTNTDFGVWYDRFVKFPIGIFSRDKRSLPAYNRWFKTVYEQKKDGVSNAILNILDDWNCLYRKERFFYVGKNRWPWRPDPVFDTPSNTHQSTASAPIIKSRHGIGFFDTRGNKNWTDTYPNPLPQQSVPQNVAQTAYDEIVNATLSEYRKNHGNLSNAELPLEPRTTQEIRIGRNKLVISDVYGDGNTLFITLKNEKDAGISIIYQEFTDCTEVDTNCQSYKESVPTTSTTAGSAQESNTHDNANTSCDNAKISQVRIRGPLGESLLIESYGNADNAVYSRIVTRGITGQLFELYDDMEDNSSYIYSLSAPKSDTTDTWSLTQGSFYIAGTGTLPQFLRLSNNPILSSMASAEQFVLQGVFSPSKQSFHANYFDSANSYIKDYAKNGSIYSSLITATSTGILETTAYDGKVQVSVDSNSHLYKIDTFGNTPAHLYFSNGSIDLYAKNKITIKGEGGISLDPGANTVVVGTGSSSVQLSTEHAATKLYSS